MQAPEDRHGVERDVLEVDHEVEVVGIRTNEMVDYDEDHAPHAGTRQNGHDAEHSPGHKP